MTAPAPRAPVAVGTDGSPPSEATLAWAAREAVRRGGYLRIVHAYLPSPYAIEYLGYGVADDEPQRQEGQRVLDEAQRRAERIAPDLELSAQLRVGPPGDVLRQESEGASLLVVGARGRGGFPGLRLGSVAAQVASHAECPVVVVPEPDDTAGPPRGTVTVGVDGSEISKEALEFAFEFATTHDLEVTAVSVWQDPMMTFPEDSAWMLSDPAAVEDTEKQLLTESLAPWQEKYPGVSVTRRVLRGHPAGELVREAGGSDLLVVGSRGRGGFLGLLLGSVSRAAVHHAPCPVAVIRHHRR